MIAVSGPQPELQGAVFQSPGTPATRATDSEFAHFPALAGQLLGMPRPIGRVAPNLDRPVQDLRMQKPLAGRGKLPLYTRPRPRRIASYCEARCRARYGAPRI